MRSISVLPTRSRFHKPVSAGFSIVELIIVIITISLLTVITTVSYRYVRADTTDTQRLTDMATIEKGLDLYLIRYGQYPPNEASNWATSSILGPDNFITALKPVLGSNTPVDPQNGSANYYRYYRYDAGTAGCDASKGRFYVLQIVSRDASRNSALAQQSEPLVCPSRTWPTSAETSIVYTSWSFEKSN